MKKFAIAAATATALTLTMANAAFAQQSTQAPMTLAAGACQFETVFTQVVDLVADGQAVSGDGGAQRAAVQLQGGLLELVHGVDTAFGVTGVELADHYCCHLGGNL